MNRQINHPFAMQMDHVPHVVVPDAVQPFFLEGGQVRGRLVRLGPVADAILRRKPGGAVAKVGGEALSLLAGLSAGLKFEGTLSLQIKGDGPLTMLIADSTHDGALRLYVRLTEEAQQNRRQVDNLGTDALLGAGYLAFTIDQGPETERQQGIVAIEGTTLAEMAESYFLTSEQHPSAIRLFARHHDDAWDAGALILERVAQGGGVTQTSQSEEDWETAQVLAATLIEDELFDKTLTSEAILFRLFGTIGVRVPEARPARFGCRCSREKLLSILAGFSENDLDDMVDNGMITMSCEFCGVDFKFDRAALSE